MRSFRRVTQRVAPALASLASVLLFATCDFDKISGTPKALTQTDVDRLFNITPGDSTVTLGAFKLLTIAPGSGGVDLGGTTQVWTSSNPGFVTVDDSGGIRGVGIGTATITARLLAPELDTGYAKTRQMRVRYKAVKVAALDSLPAKNFSRAVTVSGTNNADALQTPALSVGSGLTLTAHDSGSANTNVAQITGSNVVSKANGIAYVVALFDAMRDSVKVKVRQVAKSLTFPETGGHTATSMNRDRTLPITVRDLNDSLMTTFPVRKWSTLDTSIVKVDSLTGVFQVKKRDSTFIVVRIDTITRQQRVRVNQVVASLTKLTGTDSLSDTVAMPIHTPPTVTALDSGSTPVPGASVTFRIGIGAGANATITDSVQITNADGQATLGSWKLGDVAGANFNTVIATSGSVATTFRATPLPGRPTKLRFTVNPASATVSTNIAPAIQVSIQDSLNNVVTSASDTITLALSNNPGGATLGGTLKAAATNGVATFSNITLNATGADYSLQASGAGVPAVISNAFDVFGAKTKLAFTTQPLGTSVGAILQQVRVAIQDANGSTVTLATDSVSLSLSTNPSSATLGGTVKVAAVAGVAIFNNLQVSASGNGYVIQAAATGLTNANSNAFNIAPVGPAVKLRFSQHPTTVVAGAAITPAISVRVEDANGALVTSASNNINLEIDPSSPSGGTISNSNQSAASGLATFTSASINKAGNNYRLLAKSTGLTSDQSTTFNVNTGAPTKLAFVQPPTHTVAGQNINPAVTVEVQDAAGNRVTTSTASISLSLTGCTATLNGGGAQTASGGVATFASLNIATQVTNCVLNASATSLSGASSPAFNSISSTGAARLSFTTEPTTPVGAGNFMTGGTVTIQDPNGNNVTATTSVPITISVLSGPSTTFSGTPTRSTTSSTSFISLIFNAAGEYRLLATSPGFRPDTSAPFTVTPGSATQLGFLTQPGNLVAGGSFSPTIQIAVQDDAGNTITSATNAITLQVSGSSVPFATGSFTSVVNAVNGVATFTGLAIKKAASTVSLFATSTNLFSATSGTFDVVAGPLAALTFTQQPPSSVTAGNVFSPSVQVSGSDSVGNAISSFSSPITLALTGGTAGATLSGTKQITPTSGTASFTNLSVDKSGTGYQLSASASGLNTGTSTTFTVNAGNATKLAWISQPSATTYLNAPLAPGATTQPQIAIQDALGNTTNTNTTIRLVVATGPSAQFKNGASSVTLVDISSTNGVATLPTTLTMSTTGTYTMQASAPFNGYTPATSTSFVVNSADVKSKLAFTTQPSSSSFTLGVKPATAPVVQIQDQWGNNVTGTDAISIALGTDANPTTTLTGGGATNAVGGSASFPNLVLDKSGTGYTLVASATGLTSVTSASFTVGTPGVLVSSTSTQDMVVLNNTVYYTNSGSMRSVSTTGGTVTTHSTTGSTAWRMTTDGTNIYWSETDASNNLYIKKYVPGGSASFLTIGIAGGVDNAADIFTDGTNVYFTAGSSTAIKSISVNANNGTPTDLFTSFSRYIFVSGGFIYLYDGSSTGALQRMATSGGARTTLTPALASCCPQFAMSGGTLYFTDNNVLKSIPDASTSGLVTPTTLTNVATTVYGMTIDGSNMYLQAAATIRRYALTDFNNFTAMATNAQQSYQGTHIDGTNMIYNTNGSQIAKLPK